MSAAEPRVALVGCSAVKLDRPAPARELYTSPLFRLSLAWAEEHCDAAFIVSARYELVELDREIAPYDVKIADIGGTRDREAWAWRVVGSLVTRFGDRVIQPVLLLGEAYADPLRTPLLIRMNGYQGPAWKRPEEPLRKMMIGERLSWLKAQRGAS